jgi:IMP dehydrogenase
MQSNGAAMNGLSHGIPTGYLDPSHAEEFLDSDYVQGDGLDVKSLMDSRINGGLTYNDFLVLPGYVGGQLLYRKIPQMAI